MVAIAVQDLEKRFGDTTVLDRVSFEVPDGCFAVLVGPSGCGKSTLLRLLAGLEQADGGSIRFAGRDVSKLEPRDRDVAMVFQSYALYPHLSVRDNLAFGLKLRKTEPDEIEARVTEVSEMLGLQSLLGRMPSALSGGQRQRVAMGRAIVRRPAVFMFDEPLSNLDAALRTQVRLEIRHLHQKLETTSVYVTHDQVEAMTLADVMFVLNSGRIEQAGAPLEIYERPATRFVAGFLGSPAMSFFAATLHRDKGGWWAAFGRGDTRLRIPVNQVEYGDALQEGRALNLGVRAHDLRIVAEGTPNAITFQLELAEALGGESYAHGTVGGEALVMRLEPGHSLRPGDQFTVMVEHLHLFDAVDGRSLRC